MVIERELKKFNGMMVLLCGVIVALIMAIMGAFKCYAQINAKYETRQQVELKLEAALMEADREQLVLNNDRNLRDQAAVWADEEAGWWSDSPSVAARTAVRLTHDYETPVSEVHSREELEEALKGKMKFAPTRWMAMYFWFGLCKGLFRHAAITDAVEFAQYANWMVVMLIVLFFLSSLVNDREELLQATLAKMSLQRQARYERYIWKQSTVLFVIKVLGISALTAIFTLGVSGLAWFALEVGVLVIIIVAIPDQTIDALREKARRRLEREERSWGGRKTQKGKKPAPKSESKSRQSTQKSGNKPAQESGQSKGSAANKAGGQKSKVQRRIVDGKMVFVRVDDEESEPGAARQSNGQSKQDNTGVDKTKPNSQRSSAKQSGQRSGKKASSSTGSQKSGSKKSKKRRSLPARYYAKFERSGRETRPSLFRNLVVPALLILGISLLLQMIIILGLGKVIVIAIAIILLCFGVKAYSVYRRRVFEEWLENQDDEDDDNEEDDEEEIEDEEEGDDSNNGADDMSLAGKILTMVGESLIADAQRKTGRH